MVVAVVHLGGLHRFGALAGGVRSAMTISATTWMTKPIPARSPPPAVAREGAGDHPVVVSLPHGHLVASWWLGGTLACSLVVD
jgi:hypothetical protein